MVMTPDGARAIISPELTTGDLGIRITAQVKTIATTIIGGAKAAFDEQHSSQ